MSLPPTRWHDFVADFLLAAAFIAASALLAAWMGGVFAAGPGIKFEACSAKTCKAIGDDVQNSLGAGGTFYILPEEIVGVRQIPHCDDCATMVYRSRVSVHVMGSAANTRCRIWGGQYCIDGGMK